jgi:putative transposase
MGIDVGPATACWIQGRWQPAAFTLLDAAMILKVVADARYQREKARADYLDAERDLFERWGPSAARHLTDDDRRILARLGQSVGWKRLRKIAHVAAARTIRAWHRKLIGTPRGRSGGKTPTTPEIEALVVKFAVENDCGNDSWGRRRIAGELLGLGIDLSPSTVRRILKRHGIQPAPQRGRGRDHDLAVAVDPAHTIAIDFARTVIVDAGRLRLMYILVAIHLQSREAAVLAVTEHFDADFMAQIARNLTMADVGFLSAHEATTIIMDRDMLFTKQFRHMLTQSGVTVKRIPPQCPWENGYVERLIGTLKNLALRKVFCTSETQLWEVLGEAFLHYNRERPHQSLGNRPITPSAALPDTTKPIIRLDRLGGAIHHYVRAA